MPCGFNKRLCEIQRPRREPDEILQNQSSPWGSDRPSIVRCRVVLIGSDGHSLLLTYIRKELWLVPHTLLGHFIVTNLHSENLHDSNSVYLCKRSRHKNVSWVMTSCPSQGTEISACACSASHNLAWLGKLNRLKPFTWEKVGLPPRVTLSHQPSDPSPKPGLQFLV